MAVTLLVITVVSYTLMRLAPGDPVRAQMVGGEDLRAVDAERKESETERVLREKYHLDKHPIVGYGYWLGGIVTRFDWGTSISVSKGTPVMQLIRERIGPTLRLNICAITLVYLCAVPLGIFSTLMRGSVFRGIIERVVSLGLFVLYSLPRFWVGPLLLMFFCGDLFLNIFPVAGIEPSRLDTFGKSYWAILGMTARYYVLPVFCLTYTGLAGLSRYTRVGMLEVTKQDYIRTARAKGLSEWTVVMKHIMRNSLIPLITLFAALLPGLIAGSVIIEYIFSIPGMGQLSLMALNSRDYPLMMALFTIGATLTLIGILLSDLLYAAADPRITYE